MEQIEFVEAAFEIAISSGIVILTWPTGERRAMRVQTLEACVARINRALDEWHERARGTVVRLP